MKRPSLIQIKIFTMITVIVAVLGFLICYGAAGAFLLWICACLIVALTVGKRFKKLAIFLVGMVVGGLILWPIDAVFNFPCLRARIQAVPFGPEISVYPSPSGKCVAYIFNYSFIDSSYQVKFSHGLGFPSNRQFVPGGTLDDFRINPRWNGSLFKIEVDGLGETMSYDEETKRVSFPPVQH